MRKHSFGRDDVRIETTEIVYRGFFKMLRYSLRHRLFDGGWSRLLKRELFQRGDAVAMNFNAHCYHVSVPEFNGPPC